MVEHRSADMKRSYAQQGKCIRYGPLSGHLRISMAV